tara:strand:- start:34999 stop:37401 length:2403 start_codon:yes stop_codon:yes gene_type:complete
LAKKNYDSSSIKVLKGLEAVQKRPGMYIGDTDDGSGLHQMIFEVVDNSIDEALAGHCDEITITVHEDQSVTVEDNGRGIPVDTHTDENKSAAEVILTTLHAGGKFDDNSYKVSGGLHGVGISVVNALSEKLTLNIYKDNKTYNQEYLDSKPVSPLKPNGKCDKSGTKITFKPSKKFFSMTDFNAEILKKRFQELAYLNSGIKINYIDEIRNLQLSYKYEGGIKEYLKELIKKKTPIHDSPIYFQANNKNVFIEIAMIWTSSYQEDIVAFTNNIFQKDGGTHLAGFKTSLTRTISNYISKKTSNNKDKIDITGEDCREGLTSIISVKMSDPKFSSQTKDKLVSSEVKGIVETALNKKLFEFLEENPKDTKSLITKIYQAATARVEARKARELIRKKDPLGIGSLPGKLADCQSKDLTINELFIVEGDSAGGSAKQARDRKTQAILPLKGKILNAQRAQQHKLISSTEIASLISAIGIGTEEYDPQKLNYGKVIIMTDADVDGAHIRTLLLTLFGKVMLELFKDGKIYIAQPPLYKVKKGKSERYLLNESELSEYINKTGTKICTLSINDKKLSEDDLYKLLHSYSKMEILLNTFPKKRDREVLKHLALYKKVNIKILQDKKQTQDWIKGFEEFINNRTPVNMSYSLTVSEEKDDDKAHTISCIKTLNGVSNANEKEELHNKFFCSDAYQSIALLKLEQYLNSVYSITDESKSVTKYDSLPDMYAHITKLTKSSFTLQRYKGLGEMNPSQLEETTMNPSTRSLLKVNFAPGDEDIFEKLMGPDPESRKSTIVENYFKARVDV